MRKNDCFFLLPIITIDGKNGKHLPKGINLAKKKAAFGVYIVLLTNNDVLETSATKRAIIN